jgi:hypothetical protein
VHARNYELFHPAPCATNATAAFQSILPRLLLTILSLRDHPWMIAARAIKTSRPWRVLHAILGIRN